MFDRYSISSRIVEIQKLLTFESVEEIKPIYNAAPTKLLPVITNESPRGISFFYWGLPPNWSKNRAVSKKLIQADIEQLNSKTSYRNALKKRRCLVPADGIYLWKKVSKKGKVPYRFIQKNQKPFFMPGLWDEFEDDQGKLVHTFLIITSYPVEAFKIFDFEIPVILKDTNLTAWIDDSRSTEDLKQMLLNGSEDEMNTYPVSSNISKLNYDEPDLIEPSSPVDQFGNYSLFD